MSIAKGPRSALLATVSRHSQPISSAEPQAGTLLSPLWGALLFVWGVGFGCLTLLDWVHRQLFATAPLRVLSAGLMCLAIPASLTALIMTYRAVHFRRGGRGYLVGSSIWSAGVLLISSLMLLALASGLLRRILAEQSSADVAIQTRLLLIGLALLGSLGAVVVARARVRWNSRLSEPFLLLAPVIFVLGSASWVGLRGAAPKAPETPADKR